MASAVVVLEELSLNTSWTFAIDLVVADHRRRHRQLIALGSCGGQVAMLLGGLFTTNLGESGLFRQ